jgi:hypothetical protein
MARRKGPISPTKASGQGGEDLATSSWSPEAHRRWAQLPADTQHLVLTHVWCTQCGQAQRMNLIGGTIIVDDIVLIGTCTVCGHRVARLLEGDGRAGAAGAGIGRL